jgi:hypothetical protein
MFYDNKKDCSRPQFGEMSFLKRNEREWATTKAAVLLSAITPSNSNPTVVVRRSVIFSYDTSAKKQRGTTSRRMQTVHRNVI